MKSVTKDVLIATLLQSTPATEGRSYDIASSQIGCSNCSDGDPETPMVSLTFSRKSGMDVAVAAGYERIDRTDKDVFPGSGLTFTATRPASKLPVYRSIEITDLFPFAPLLRFSCDTLLRYPPISFLLHTII